MAAFSLNLLPLPPEVRRICEAVAAPPRLVAHERVGEELLAGYGVTAKLARFTRTHAAWRDDRSLALEDLLVSLADNCWKGKRVVELEERIAALLAAECARELWEVFSAVDDIVCWLAMEADDRLAWQAQHPV